MSVLHIYKLPEWADNKARLTQFGDRVIIVHPEHEPHVWHNVKQKWIPFSISAKLHKKEVDNEKDNS